MSEEHVVGHIGYSPDFKSKPKSLPANIRLAPPLDSDGNIRSIDLVKHQMSAAEFKALKKRVLIDAHDQLLEEVDRLRDLVWKNFGVIDFTGFEDILEQIEKARDG